MSILLHSNLLHFNFTKIDICSK